jgi:group I intron endonuclease
MKTGIYRITCLANSKIYIGSSFDIDKRWKVHKNQLNKNKHINIFLQNSYNKYGSENFKFEILEECEKENLLQLEQKWMDETKCYDRKNGFNACLKSDRPFGYKHLKNDKIKMSEIKKEQYKNGLISSNFTFKTNFKHSEETKQKIRESKLGEKNPMYGKFLSKERKEINKINLNSVPRWNKGLTKNDDIRLLKLSFWKGKLPPNAMEHKLINLDTNEEWIEKSLKHLSEICPLSLTTLSRLKVDKAGKKVTQKYKLIW